MRKETKKPVPRKPADQLKGEVVKVLLTAEQRATLQQAAERSGMSLSTWIRAAALMMAVPPQSSGIT
jgi:uncharacterized protein (DUF1778 family)